MTAPSLPPLPEVPHVSVLTLAYNHEAFVGEAVESVLAQEWPAERLQYVVLDDGSSDGTTRVLDRYRDDPRVTIVEQRNAGLREAVNRGLALLTGDVLTFVAGDDAALPNRVSCLVEALRRNPQAGLAYSDVELVDDAGTVLERSFLDAARLPRVSGRIRGRLLARNVIPSTGVALRASLLPAIHPAPPWAPWEDYWWAWAVSGVADVVHVPQVTYRYRFHGGNLSLGARGAAFAGIVDQELPFRRFMLGDVAEGEAVADELLAGIAALWGLVEHASEAGAAQLVPSAQELATSRRQLAEAIDATAAGDRDGAALACCRAAAAHPLDPALVALVREIAAETAERPARAARDRGVLDELGARRFVVLADAGMLVSRPELLRAYGASFGADDDATLVIHADGREWDRLSAAIPQLVADAGLDGDAAPDMVFTTEPPDRFAAIAAAADAHLGSDSAATGATPFDVADVDALALLARRAAAVS